MKRAVRSTGLPCVYTTAHLACEQQATAPRAALANFGMILRAHQPAGKRYMTVNARSEAFGA